jgi:hypothetical protein
MNARRPALALLLALAGCIDFVDPVGLGLARDTRIELAFDLVDDPRRSVCPGPASVPADAAVLCVQATVVPGITRLGERLRVLDDSLRVMGIAVAPLQRSDSLLVYERRFFLPLASLESVPLTASLPRVEGVDVVPRDIRWFAVGPANPDTLVRRPGEGVTLRVDRPQGESAPRPTFEFWRVDVAGDTAVVRFDGFGVPLPAYEFPAEVLSTVGGSRFAGELRWLRSYTPLSEGLQFSVRFDERLRWTILTDTAPAARGARSREAGGNKTRRRGVATLTRPGAGSAPERGGDGVSIRSVARSRSGDG